MRGMPQQQLDERALAVWKWSGLISSLISWIVTIFLVFAAFRFNWPWWIAVIAGVLTLLETLLLVTVLPKRRWQRWRYEIRENEIDLQHGFIFQKRTVIPMVRVQHVDTNQGPIMRKYGLSSVTFSTAAGNHEIPALANELADKVRDQIAELARVSHEDI
ncbi:PH domain-containing protein [Paenibacillus eucommiae]|uniref:Membrane protein YdbS with pleckstrin-like domain n=1 Tax=Paenibacillus eucommiae TaxID=1355755 RepID=A0ABS4JAU8_9BACL|nr:PH domain-containing protein [Paenibacillus eucommiae]MBP1995864.1 membrane protein YdbS with pleckstrin-like domain [Paenibacillus eucommiae]